MTPLMYEALLKCKKDPDTRWGICKNVADFVRASNIDYELKAATLQEVVNELDALIEKWPDKAREKGKSFSHYPVEGNYRVYDTDQARGELWENPRRIALLDWLLEQQSCE